MLRSVGSGLSRIRYKILDALVPRLPETLVA